MTCITKLKIQKQNRLPRMALFISSFVCWLYHVAGSHVLTAIPAAQPWTAMLRGYISMGKSKRENCFLKYSQKNNKNFPRRPPQISHVSLAQIESHVLFWISHWQRGWWEEPENHPAPLWRWGWNQFLWGMWLYKRGVDMKTKLGSVWSEKRANGQIGQVTQPKHAT